MFDLSAREIILSAANTSLGTFSRIVNLATANITGVENDNRKPISSIRIRLNSFNMNPTGIPRSLGDNPSLGGSLPNGRMNETGSRTIIIPSGLRTLESSESTKLTFGT